MGCILEGRKSPELSQPQNNKKQCSRQVQSEVPCGVGNVINSSLFITSSLSSLSSTSHAVWGGLAGGGGSSGGRGVWQGEGLSGRGGGQATFQSSCHTRMNHLFLGFIMSVTAPIIAQRNHCALSQTMYNAC